ncbi:hypothetical protein UFOVP152_26 [uncultured Caudovirales phage]|uniref:Uncharacterized protein n=1 Tax=uncultured Caudovirales phage TaxID=2100421 RepID=A0A6J7WBH3_9CAUD|nr:hypothetical protein UFOVP152_26 [uncultured Caudovirales phage]
MIQLTLPFGPRAVEISAKVLQTALVCARPKSSLLVRIVPRGSRAVVLTDHEVELVRQVHEMGGITLRELAEKFEVSKSSIHYIVTYQRRPYAA